MNKPNEQKYTATNKKDPGIKIPPQSMDSEMAFLGSILLRPDAIGETFDNISPSHFYSDRNKKIYETMVELYSKSTPIDLISISSRLKEKKILEQVGGKSYLTELVESVPSSANIKHYADIIVKKATFRKLITVAEEISAIGYNEEHEMEEAIDEAEKKIMTVAHSSNQKSYIELKDTLPEAWERLEKLHNSKEEMRGISTGFKSLDNKLAGFQKSDLIILAARPSVGKTSLALDIARIAAVRDNVPVAIFSLEMAAQQLIDRMLAAQSQVDSWSLRTGNLHAEADFDRIRDSLDVLSKAPIFIDDRAANNIISMKSTARKMKIEKGLGLIIVDYLQLMVPTQSRNSDNMVQQVTEISRSLKALARELNIPVIALSQLSRAVEQRGGRPRLSDLRDSGSIEQDADVVMFIHREDKNKDEAERTNVAEILIEKHRNGPTGRVELYFDDKKTTFREVENKNYQDLADF